MALKHWAFLVLLTVLITFLALTRLGYGAGRVPQTSWQPATMGDFIIVDFGDTVNVRSMMFYNGHPNREPFMVGVSETGHSWERHYYNANLTEEELFSRAFNETARRIMTVTRSRCIPFFVITGGTVIIAILFLWWMKIKEQKNLEAEQMERILSQPLEVLSDSVPDEASILAEQYNRQ